MFVSRFVCGHFETAKISNTALTGYQIRQDRPKLGQKKYFNDITGYPQSRTSIFLLNWIRTLFVITEKRKILSLLSVYLCIMRMWQCLCKLVLMTSLMTQSGPKIYQNIKCSSVCIYLPYSRITLAGTVPLQLAEIYYRNISNIRRLKYQNLNDSHLVLQSSLPSPLRPGVKSRMKM